MMGHQCHPGFGSSAKFVASLEPSSQSQRTGGNMLTRLIVALYAWLLELALWLMLPLAGVVGYHVTVPLMVNAGAVLANELAWKLCGALLFPIIAFLVAAVVIGPLLILVDVRQAVRRIESSLERKDVVSASHPIQRKEPSL
jgi:hypothetical protein